MRLLLPLLILELISVKGFSASQAISMNPDKRLRAIISADSMNRLAVVNDRITQIFGDQEAYEVQTEETTGQLFLKPTVENGKKPLAITLITENGLTQDMTLEPVERDATTVILKNSGAPSDISPHGTSLQSGATQFLGAGPLSLPRASSSGGFTGWPDPGSTPGMGVSLSFQDQVIAAMKYLVCGMAPVIDIYDFNRKCPQGSEISTVEFFNLGGFKGFKLVIKNKTDLPIDILEKDFYQEGDLALSFQKRILPAKASTILYVVAR